MTDARNDGRKRLSDHDAINMCIERLQGTTLSVLALKYAVSYGTAQLICRGLSRPSALRTAREELAKRQQPAQRAATQESE